MPMSFSGNRTQRVERDAGKREKFNRIFVFIYIMWSRRLHLRGQNKNLGMLFKIITVRNK